VSEIPIIRQAQRDLDLGRLALAAFDILRDRLDLVEFRPVKLQEMMASLSRSRPQVIGAMRTLVARGYIEKGSLAWARGPRLYRLCYSRGKSIESRSEVAAAPTSSRRYGMISRGIE